MPPGSSIAWVWLVGGVVFVLMKHLLPGVTAYANYRSRFKQDIVAGIFKVVCPSAVYDPLQGVTKDVFDAPGLFNTRGSFESDDRVRGHIGQTPFEASEVGRGYSTGTGKNSRSHTVFRGLFFHLDLNQRLTGVTLIDPEKARSHQLGEREGLSLVTLDNPEFEKEFKVHASNESEARALLTPAMIEALLTLRRQAGKRVFLAFKEQRAYLGVDYDRKLFEPGVAMTTSKEAVREIAAHFAFVETIVRELNVNARAFAAGDDSLLRAPDVEPDPLSRLAAQTGGTMTTSDVWAMASASIDDSAKDGASVPKPERTRISLVQEPAGLSITYGLRLGFWVMLAISAAGALLAVERAARRGCARVGPPRVGVGADPAARAAARRLRGRCAHALADCRHGRRRAVRAHVDGLRPPRGDRSRPHPDLPRLPALSAGLSPPAVRARHPRQHVGLHRQVRGPSRDESHGVAGPHRGGSEVADVGDEARPGAVTLVNVEFPGPG